jgi:putative flippase GtrA
MKKEFLLYAAVSALALAVDVAILYLATARFAMPSYIAAALAYAIGLAVHYVLSVRHVFTYRRMAAQRRTEVMVYALTGLVGILLSAGIVHAGDLLGQSLAVSKLVAIAVSFIAVFMIRKITLFSADKNSAKEAA